mmetsp:Transcript_85424/g.169447  ORF Transcript_85424/g.169447 Transcript_85424/m.169447 type:complete len:358 (-) Transcript_85424:158-1231(-)
MLRFWIFLPLCPSSVFSEATYLTDLEDECKTTDLQQLFACWCEKYPTTVSKFGMINNEFTQRLAIFRKNLVLIREHNANPASSWTMSVNEFAAHTWDEFAAEKLSTPQDCSATHRVGIATPTVSPVFDVPPTSKDWRDEGIVTPVKNQGACGSCWTFSTTGVVEAHYAKATGNLVSLSEQQLVDCAADFNNHGCQGGLPSQAMEYIRYRGGLQKEVDYPYNGRNQKCNSLESKAVAHIADVVNITQGDENGILLAVGTVGPVSIAYDCTLGFQFYHKGVYDGWFCGTKPSQVNHAVLAVGYGHDSKSGKDYWLVKNSWGASFGEKGYFRIVRNKNKCGLADCASYPTMQTTSSAVLV